MTDLREGGRGLGILKTPTRTLGFFHYFSGTKTHAMTELHVTTQYEEFRIYLSENISQFMKAFRVNVNLCVF